MNISKEKLVWMLLIDMLVWILVGVLKMLKMLVETRTLVETLVKKKCLVVGEKFSSKTC